MYYLDAFLAARPAAQCALAGMGAYATAVVPDHENTTVKTSHFRTYHTVLTTQQDFIDGYDAALGICDSIEVEYPGVGCFPYSIFYVFFEQYRNIIPVSIGLVFIAAGKNFFLFSFFPKKKKEKYKKIEI